LTIGPDVSDRVVTITLRYLILQSSFHVRLVSGAAPTQALITLDSASSPELSKQPKQSLRSP
jgi:hypothetical protein